MKVFSGQLGIDIQKMRTLSPLLIAAWIISFITPTVNGQTAPADMLGTTAALRAAIESRVDDIVSRMTLDEKIDLIGGRNRFRMHSIPRLNIPVLQMADGPVGAHIPQPAIAYAGGY